MIIRKPYAILIKYFKLIHIILFLIMGYLVFRLRDIYMFFSDYFKTETFSLIENMSLTYLPIIMYVFVIIIIIASIFIYALMKEKDKPVTFYKLLIGYGTVLLIAMIVFNNSFSSLEEGSYSILNVAVYRDIALALYIVNFVFVIFSFIRGFGFDIKKFSFDQDKKILNIEETDNEEVEVNVNVDKDKIMMNLRKEKREFGYYLKENKKTLIILSILLVLGITAYILLNIFVFNKIYKENEFLKGDDYIVGITSARITNYSYNHEIINDKYSYLVINFDYKNYTKSAEIDTQLFKLDYNGNSYYPIKRITTNDGKKDITEFNDLGTLYKFHTTVSKDKKVSYLMVFEIPKVNDLVNIDREFIVNVKINNDYKRILVNAETDRETELLANLNEPIDKLDLNIKSYAIRQTDTYYYEKCESEDNCRKFTKIVSPKINENLLVLEIESNNENIDNILEYYLSIDYTIDGVEKTNTSKDITVVGSNTEGTMIYLSIDKKILNASSIDLVIQTRENRIKMNLRDD